MEFSNKLDSTVVELREDFEEIKAKNLDFKDK